MKMYLDMSLRTKMAVSRWNSYEAEKCGNSHNVYYTKNEETEW
jgi:hypothetical protein